VGHRPRINPADRRTVIHRDGRKCRYCGRAVQERPNPHKARADDLTIDHVVPRHMGGGSTVDNMVVACHKCNHEKDRTLLPEKQRMELVAQNLAYYMQEDFA
jgi:5-methylcytosine-specific restriction endonuclease McrA